MNISCNRLGTMESFSARWSLDNDKNRGPFSPKNDSVLRNYGYAKKWSIAN